MPLDRSMRAGGLRSAGAVELSAGSTWQPLGPRPIQSKNLADRNWGNVSGRISAIAVHPTDPSILLLASATGGVWKSTDAGASWRPVTDHAASLAGSAVVFAPSNPLVAYAATGEVDEAGAEAVPSQSLGIYLGAGLLRSADGGETWTRVDLDLPANAVLSRVVVSPTDPQNVLVGIYLSQDLSANSFHSGGVYRSTDGGVHFTRTFSNRISDLIGDPGDVNRVYLAAARCPDCPNPSGVYVSADFGRTWSASLTPGNPPANFTSPSGRIRLGAARASGATVLYASVLDTENSHANGGIFRSGDGGASWAKVSTASTMCPSPASANQCSYDHWIAAEPGSSSTVYFGSIDLYKSSDSGATWSKLTDNYNTRNVQVPVHPDQHGATPGVPAGTFYFTNDGGVYRTRDGGLSFENLNATLTLAQFNGITLHPTLANFAMGGTQDNGNLFYSGTAAWSDRTSGDGGIGVIRFDNPDHILASHYYARLAFSPDGGENFLGATPCNVLMDCSKDAPIDDMAFYPPIVTAPAAPGTVLLGSNRIWANPVFGSDARQWKPRSSASVLPTAGEFFTALDVLGDGSGTIWAGSDLGSVLVSTDGGATFVSMAEGLPAAVVTRIVAADPDGRTVYVAFGGFLGAPSRHVFRTTDGGTTWTNVSSNLPDVPVLSLTIDPNDENDLFVGSDAGVFRSVDGGANWSSFSQGLPNAAVTDLRFSRVSGELYASTYGRGAFRIAAPEVAPVAEFSPAVSVLVAGQSVLFVDISRNRPTAWAWNFGDPSSGASNTSTSKNPRHTFASPGAYTVTLTATNEAGTSEVSHTVVVGSSGACHRCPRVVPSH
jgi:photosystem II stability/assembly factor-like uncharacterized protein